MSSLFVRVVEGRDAEIGQPSSSVGSEENICSFDVSVDNHHSMQVTKSLTNLVRHHSNLRFCQALKHMKLGSTSQLLFSFRLRKHFLFIDFSKPFSKIGRLHSQSFPVILKIGSSFFRLRSHCYHAARIKQA